MHLLLAIMRFISCLDSPDFLNLTDLQYDERNVALSKFNVQGTGVIDAISAGTVRIDDQVIISDDDGKICSENGG